MSAIDEAFALLYQRKLPMEIVDNDFDESGFCRKFKGSSSNVLSFLNTLRKGKEAAFCDVVLEVDGESFPAHRCVLAANSQFFYTLFTSGMRDSKEKHVNLRSLSSSTVSTILDFFYGGHIFIRKDNAEELLETANFLLLNQVKNACAEMISSNLSISNCFYTKLLAERYSLDDLKRDAHSCIKENFQAAKHLKEFLELEPFDLKEIISSDSVRVEKEEEVFHAVMNWVKHNPTKRANELSTLLPCLRYGSLSSEFLEKQFKEDPIFEEISFCQNFLMQGCHLSAICEKRPIPKRPSTRIHDVVIGIGRGKVNASFCYEVHTDQIYQLPKPQSPVYQFGAAAIGQDPYTVSCDGKGCNHRIRCDSGNVNHLTKLRLGSIDPFAGHFCVEIDTSPLKANTCNKKAIVLSLKDKLYIVGGCMAYADRSVDIQCYDPAEGEWKAMANMNTSRCMIGAVATNNYIYAVGGAKHHPGTAEKLVERYNPDTNTWTPMADMCYPRVTPQVVANNDSIFVISEIMASTGRKLFLCCCEVYRESRDEWSIIAELPRRYPMVSLSWNDEVYVIAGGKTWKYSEEKDLWEKSPTPMFKALQHEGFGDFYYVQLKLPKFCYDQYRKITWRKVNNYDRRPFDDEDESDTSVDEYDSSDESDISVDDDDDDESFDGGDYYSYLW